MSQSSQRITTPPFVRLAARTVAFASTAPGCPATTIAPVASGLDTSISEETGAGIVAGGAFPPELHPPTLERAGHKNKSPAANNPKALRIFFIFPPPFFHRYHKKEKKAPLISSGALSPILHST